MATVEISEKHQELVDELLNAVAAYNPDVDRDLITRAFRFAAKAHEGQVRRSGQEFIHHPLGVAKILAELQLDDETIAAALLHDVVEDTDTELDDIRAEFGDEVARLVDGVTKLTRIQFQTPRAGRGRELPQDDRGDGRGRPRDPHQARRPPPQPAHDRVPRQAEAGAEGEGDARGLRAARAPPRHPRAQVGARGPRLRDAAPAQVRGDQGDGQRAPRRPRGARPRRRRDPARPSSTRSTSRPRSPAARSTSTRSTTRWRRRAASSTRSTT